MELFHRLLKLLDILITLILSNIGLSIVLIKFLNFAFIGLKFADNTGWFFKILLKLVTLQNLITFSQLLVVGQGLVNHVSETDQPHRVSTRIFNDILILNHGCILVCFDRVADAALEAAFLFVKKGNSPFVLVALKSYFRLCLDYNSCSWTESILICN